MHLTQLDLQGFKSFANKTTLEFRAGAEKPHITAIVGPNGCGKTNLLEAVRWVLGEQSLKTLRGKKSEDVIFSGSDKKASLGLAEVSLHLDNRDGRIPLEYKDIIITRRLYRSGESEYLINKSKVRLLDLQLLLAKANIGTKSYSIIGQGMTDAVLAASAAERKNFFDEAAGVKKFQIKQDQATNKLTAAQSNLTQAENLLREISPRLRSLTRQVKKLERREELSIQLKNIQADYYGSFWHELANSVKTTHEEFKKIKTLAEKQEREVLIIREQLNNLEQEKSRAKIFNELQNNYQNLLEKKNELRAEEMTLKNEIELAKKLRAKAPVVLSVGEILKELEDYQAAQEKLIKNLLAVENTEELNQIKNKLTDLGEKLKRLIEKIKNPAPVEKNDNEDAKLLKKLEEIAPNLKEIGTAVENTQKKIIQFNEAEEDKKSQFFNLQRELQGKQEKLNELNTRASDIKVQLARFETQQENLEAQLREDEIVLFELRPVKLSASEREGKLLEMGRLKHQLELIGGIDPEVQTEYEETKERHDFLSSQSNDLSQAIADTERIIEDLNETIKKLFAESFHNINEHFQKYFKMLFKGGKANLVLEKKVLTEETEEENRTEILPALKLASVKAQKIVSGVEIIATPPGKRVKNVSMLSGGERALTSLSLICAIISANPSPFVILDEVDAALDEANSERFAEIIDELSQHTQFIVITHNRATMQKAGILYGITMGADGVSKLLSVKLEEAGEANQEDLLTNY